MELKKGSKIKVTDSSYAFGLCNGSYRTSIPQLHRHSLTVVQTNLSVTREKNNDRQMFCDLLITDENGNFWFIQSRFCEPVDKEIEIQYFCDGKNVTNDISDETKRSLCAKDCQ